MVVNLYVDHMMATPPATAEEVWNATREHPALYSEAARKIGLSSREYQEFRDALLDGRAIYVALPQHIDAMAGDRHGSIYAVQRAFLPRHVMGWKVTLSSGAVVYVPQTCGNLSVSRRVSYVAPARYVPPAPARQPLVAAAHETPVTFQPPPVEAPPPPAAVVAPAAGGAAWLIGLPILGAIIYFTTQPPHCSSGSNEMNVCQATRK